MFLIFGQHSLSSIYKARSLKHQANAKKAGALTWFNATGCTTRSVYHHIVVATLLQFLQPVQFVSSSCQLRTMQLCTNGTIPRKALQNQLLGSNCQQEKLLDFRNIMHSKQTRSAMVLTMNSCLYWNNLPEEHPNGFQLAFWGFALHLFPLLAITDKDSGLTYKHYLAKCQTVSITPPTAPSFFFFPKLSHFLNSHAKLNQLY